MFPEQFRGMSNNCAHSAGLTLDFAAFSGFCLFGLVGIVCLGFIVVCLFLCGLFVSCCWFLCCLFVSFFGLVFCSVSSPMQKSWKHLK